MKLLISQCSSAGGSNPVFAVLHAEASCLQSKPAHLGASHPHQMTFSCHARGSQDNFQSMRAANKHEKECENEAKCIFSSLPALQRAPSVVGQWRAQCSGSTF